MKTMFEGVNVGTFFYWNGGKYLKILEYEFGFNVDNKFNAVHVEDGYIEYFVFDIMVEECK